MLLSSLQGPATAFHLLDTFSKSQDPLRSQRQALAHYQGRPPPLLLVERHRMNMLTLADVLNGGPFHVLLSWRQPVFTVQEIYNIYRAG
jgi:hypothetical protein